MRRIKFPAFLFVFFVFFGLAGCQNPFLMEMFGPKGQPLENIIITNIRGRQIQRSFTPTAMFYDYVTDSNVRIRLELGRGATVRWGFTNLNNGYNGEIAVPLVAGTTKQVLISVTGKRGPAKIYIITFSKTDAYYLRASAPDFGDGSYEHPFNTFSDAISAAALTSTKTIFVDGVIPGATGGDTSFIVDTNFFPIRFVGIAGTGAALKGSEGKRLLSVQGMSNVRFEDIIITGDGSTNASNKGISIDGGATVTLGTEAYVREFGTDSIYKGIYVAGNLAIAGRGSNPGRVLASTGNAVGEVYLAGGRKIQIEERLSTESGVLAKIRPATYPSSGGEILVLSGAPMDVYYNHTNFQAADVAYRLTNEGKLVENAPSIEDNIWYVDATSGDDLSHDGKSDSTPFKTLGKALQAVNAAGGAQIIKISGTLDYNSESGTTGDTDPDSVFFINGLGAKQLTLIGVGAVKLSNQNASGGKRVLKVVNSTIEIENITIESYNASTKDGGSIYISSGASVTLGAGVDVKGNAGSTGNGKGVFVGGSLIIGGTPTAKVSVGDIYLSSGKKIGLENGIATGSLIATISTEVQPTPDTNVPVLSGFSEDIQRASTRFSSFNADYQLLLNGELMIKNVPDGTWYVAAGGNDANSGVISSKPFLTLGKALTAIQAYAADGHSTELQTINVTGTLTSANAGVIGGAESIFVFNNTGNAEILIKGGILSSPDSSHRVVEVTGNSNIRFESITIQNTYAVSKDGGGIRIGTGATVTLGSGADVKGDSGSTGNGKGVYVEGILAVSSTGKVSVGDVYLYPARTIFVADELGAGAGATITLPLYPGTGGYIQVLDGDLTLLSRHYTKFTPTNASYSINDEGLLEKK